MTDIKDDNQKKKNTDVSKSKKKRRIRRRKGPKRYYFDEETQRNIELFQKTSCKKEQARIYMEGILPAFEKLVDNLITIYKFQGLHSSHEELKNDCIVFLYESLHKFDGSLGTKAFSYFNVVAKRWLIVRSRKRSITSQRFVSLDSVDHFGQQRYDSMSMPNKIAAHVDMEVPASDDKMITLERPEQLLRLLNEIRNHLTNENELKCIDSIITLFERSDDLPMYKKRPIFAYIREMSGLTPKQLTMAISVIKRHYYRMKNCDEFGIF